MNIFEFEDYKKYVVTRIRSLGNQGRGGFTKLGEFVPLHTTTVSQVFKGNKNLTLEQACRVAEYFGFGDRESQYFVLLVQKERAGSEQLRKLIQSQLLVLKKETQELVNRVPRDRVLTAEQKVVFYSHWYYSAVRVLSSIPGFQTVDSISDRLGLPKRLVAEVIEFLLVNGLCVEKDGLLAPGPRATHLEGQSPLVARHHANWRLKAIERQENLTSEELCYTGPLSIAKKDALRIRERLVKMIQEVNNVVAPSECEVFYCFSLDWFEVGGSLISR